MKEVKEERLEVEEFFRGTCILVTGATGAVGKVLVEKLLRSCSGLHTIYVLIRDKNQLPAQQRFKKLLQSQLFDKVRDRLDKIQLVNGDIMHVDLSLNSEDKQHLMHKINVVIHCAASIKFQNPLKQAFICNSLSTQYLLDFCKQIHNLKDEESATSLIYLYEIISVKDVSPLWCLNQSVVYMSTAYCNANIKVKIEEKVYPLPEDLESLVNLALTQSDELDSLIDWTGLEKKFIPTYLPNTYVTTKAVSETLVSRAAAYLPICIVRPSIVACCMDEPIEGWVDSFSLITSVILGGSIGSVLPLYCDSTTVADIIPLEMVAHSTILAATAVNDHEKRVKVYHITTGGENPITWGKLLKLGLKHSRNSPPERAILYPITVMTTSWLLYFALYIFHLIISLLVDLTLLLRAKKPKMVTMVMKGRTMNKLGYWVINQTFQFCNSNMAELSRRRSSKEIEMFKTDARQIDWDSYIRIFIQGIKRHILHENLDQLSPSQTQRQWLKLQTLLLMSLAACCCYLIYYYIRWTLNMLLC